MDLVSARMRASLKGKHVSGAERIVLSDDIPEVLKELLNRPKNYDSLIVTLERLGSVETFKAFLPVSSYTFSSVEEAREFALSKLIVAGVPESVARRAISLISEGANPKGGNMRGAVLMDINSGERLEPDRERGIRTVRVDWENRRDVKERILSKGYTERTLDALALANKNILCGVVAELCWSDDPDYLTGYVASKKTGYVRITPLKEKGDPLGGRVYFIPKEKTGEIIRCLEKRAILLRW